MSNSWDFMMEQGVMTNDDYGYRSGNSGREYDCVHDTSKIWGYVTEYKQINTTVDDMKARVMQQPLSIALDAGKAAFQYYDSGVVTEADNCGTTLNHAVVIVGYTDEDGDDGDDGDDDSNPDPSPGPDPEPEPPRPRTCKVRKWWHTCRDDETAERRLADSNGNNNYWKIQNSWGTGWGDNGFILLEITGGYGVCGMNSVVEYVNGCQVGVDAGCTSSRA